MGMTSGDVLRWLRGMCTLSRGGAKIFSSSILCRWSASCLLFLFRQHNGNFAILGIRHDVWMNGEVDNKNVMQ